MIVNIITDKDNDDGDNENDRLDNVIDSDSVKGPFNDDDIGLEDVIIVLIVVMILMVLLILIVIVITLTNHGGIGIYSSMVVVLVIRLL